MKLDSGSADSGVKPDSGSADSGAKPDSGSSTMDAASDAKAPDSGAECVIGGTTYASGAANPTNACESCQPTVATSAWSDVSDGTACSSARFCHTGACMSGCEIAGAFYAISAPNPNNPCESCQPGMSTSAWSDRADGTACGTGEVCASGACGMQCDIPGIGIVASGAVNPANACESCQPGTSTSAWTSAQGINANCPAGDVCKGAPASCTSGCWIAGSFVSSGGTANSGCEVCTPGTSTTAWTDVTGDASCAAGKVCNAGSCAAGCSIAGSFVSPGAAANDGCEVCEPGTSTTAWTDVYGDASCAAGETCNAGNCASCVVGALWSMTVNTITAVPTLCQGVMDCTSDCVLFNGTSTEVTPTTLDWNVSPGGTLCDTFAGQVSASGQFTSDQTDCTPEGDGTTFDGQIDVATCSMSGTYTYVLGGCTVTYTITGTQ